MRNNIKKFFGSAGASSFAGVVYLITSYILDYYTNPKLANIIGLIIGSIFNFFIQTKLFLDKKKLSEYHIFKYGVVELGVLIANQIIVSQLIDHKKKLIEYLPDELKKYYNTIVRIIAGQIVFSFFSYPLRRYWVYI